MNRSLISAGAAALGAACAFAAVNSVFVVGQTEAAVVTDFSGAAQVVDTPGLHLKAPWQGVKRLDKRDQGLSPDAVDVTAADQSHLLVQTLVRYRITDPLAFQAAAPDENALRSRLDGLVQTPLRQALAAAAPADIIAGRAALPNALVQADAAAKAAHLGLTVVDLQIRRVEPVPSALAGIDQRMTQQSQETAAQVIAGGEERKREIMADANKQAATIKTGGDDAAASVRAETDAEVAQIDAKSFGRDPEFATFYRSMQAYAATFGQGDVTFVLAGDNPFLKYMRQGPTAP